MFALWPECVCACEREHVCLCMKGRHTYRTFDIHIATSTELLCVLAEEKGRLRACLRRHERIVWVCV